MILLLAGCVSTREAEGIYVTDTQRVPLLPTSAMEGTVDALHVLSGTYGERTFNVNAYTYADSERISMTIMSAMGNTIASLEYEGDTIAQAASPLGSVPFSPEYIFFDFQLCFYRVDKLNEVLNPAGLFLSEQQSDGVSHRILSSGSTPITTIERSGKRLSLVNHLRGYAYQIEVVDDA